MKLRKDFWKNPEMYIVKFWIKKGEFWEQKEKTYFSKTKGDHSIIEGMWKKDFSKESVELISVEYQ